MSGTPMALVQGMLQRSYASRALELNKMKELAPFDVESPLYNFRCKVVEMVYDPLRIAEVNAEYAGQGFNLDDGLTVIAVNEDGSLLVWGGFNSVFHLSKGDTISGPFDEKHLVFDDILGLTGRFNIKNKKPEIDELIARMKELYTPAE